MDKKQFLQEAAIYGYDQAAALDAIEFTEQVLACHLKGMRQGPMPRFSQYRAILLGQRGVIRLQKDLEEILRG